MSLGTTVLDLILQSMSDDKVPKAGEILEVSSAAYDKC